ncbi:OmpA family protein [Hydrogenophaga sp. PAMC20947]|uniref:OmpA family protein n=1 Tax=Hydrogenophaga sp. PAMC20947 TaxID=2565558 RepID=UPI00109DB9E3|nr:OmpA family protein [Hydrogenophaga sp. PAMC20947]QCB44791.1 OmpA family protein [Hydrogenophaga sp. PAMC20947]
MSSQDNDQDTRVVAVVLISTILLAVGLALGVGISKARSGGATESGEVAVAAAAPAADAPADAAPVEADGAAAPASNDDASVVIENGVVKFYFASAKADLAPGALVALGDAIAAAKAGKRLVLSGFHDASGNAAMNAELAGKRALSVRDALVGAGVAESSMDLKKPEESTGSGNDAEARRVEVTIVE